jgi:16S rRNA (guanine1207-N2)-methyltransferase
LILRFLSVLSAIPWFFLSMSRRKRYDGPLSQREVPETVRAKLRPPLAIVLGSPAEVVNLLRQCPTAPVTCYQMDLHQTDRLREALKADHVGADVVTLSDLWDLPADYQTAVFMPARAGERDLKIDMVEQAFHILRPRGALVVWSSYETDPFFPTLLKKVFGRVHAQCLEGDSVFWCQRDGERPRRRHEITFQARIGGGESCRFLSRPGTFSYGRFDNGARALAETMAIHSGDRVVDIGCGCGTNGVFAAQQAGTNGFVAFIDSNVRAVALAEHNAHTNGVTAFQVVASSNVIGVEEGKFDVALANPPYYTHHAIARLFVERGRKLLKRQGRLYLVTKQPSETAAIIEQTFGAVEALMHRGYTILCA